MKKLVAFLCGVMCILVFSCLDLHPVLPFQYVGKAPTAAVPIKTIPIYLDKNFGIADQIAIDDAVSQWNYALNGYVVLKVVSTNFDMEPEIIQQCMGGACWMLLKVDSNASFVPDEDSKHLTLAWANDIGGNRIYFVRDRIDNDWMTGIALHEMGHLLGAKHDNVYLMQPQFNWRDGRCVDQQAAYLVANYWGIPVQNVKYCVYGVTK